MTRNALDPGIQAYYRAASTERLVNMLNLGREAIATGNGATARTPVAVAFIESILASRGVKA